MGQKGVTRSVRGSPRSSALPGNRQARRRSDTPLSFRPCKGPKTERVEPAPRRQDRRAYRTTPSMPWPRTKPPRRNNTAVDSTVRLARSEMRTPNNSNTAKASVSIGIMRIPHLLARVRIQERNCLAARNQGLLPGRTTRTGHGAWWATWLEVDPSSSPANPPCPRHPRPADPRLWRHPARQRWGTPGRAFP